MYHDGADLIDPTRPVPEGPAPAFVLPAAGGADICLGDHRADPPESAPAAGRLYFGRAAHGKQDCGEFGI